MNAEEKLIYKERIDSLSDEIAKSWDTFRDGLEITLINLGRDDPDFITRLNLTCDKWMADKLAEQLTHFRDVIDEIRGEFQGEVDNAE